uniref:Major facilitator superfamily (MFS) profile domain-containing protein n=4 Tax=Triticinae TaxID=1648030 RepID=A0A453CBQ7_AEGTS
AARIPAARFPVASPQIPKKPRKKLFLEGCCSYDGSRRQGGRATRRSWRRRRREWSLRRQRRMRRRLPLPLAAAALPRAALELRARRLRRLRGLPGRGQRRRGGRRLVLQQGRAAPPAVRGTVLPGHRRLAVGRQAHLGPAHRRRARRRVPPPPLLPSRRCVIGATSMLMISLQSNLGLIPAVLALTAQSAGAAIADVTLDALVAQNSITHPPLAADMQSLCGFCSSFGSLIGYSISGLLVHSMGAQGALGLLSIPSALVFSAGILLKESRVTNFNYKQVHKKFYKAIRSTGTTLKCPEVWRPCLYIYVSLNLSLDIQGGMFYWYTDRLNGPGFSEEFIGVIYAVGAVGSLLGVVLYQSALKDYDFRSMLLWGQVLSSLTGMLDLALVTRLNTKVGIPDYVFAVIDCGVSVMVGKLQWMPVLVLCSKLCPPGIEGTFYALLMSIQNVGLLMSAWWGGLLLHTLNVTRSEFTNLWAVVLIRNVSRLLPLMLLFLVPQSDQNSTLLPAEMLHDDESTEAVKDGSGSVEFSVLVADGSGCHPSVEDVQDERIKVTDDVGGDVELIPLMNTNRTVG